MGESSVNNESINVNNLMNRINASPLNIQISDDKEVVKCEAIRHLYFSNIHATCSFLPRIIGRENCPVEKIYFNNCTFEKTGKYQPKHGAGGYWTKLNEKFSGTLLLINTKDLNINNTTFTNI